MDCRTHTHRGLAFSPRACPHTYPATCKSAAMHTARTCTGSAKRGMRGAHAQGALLQPHKPVPVRVQLAARQFPSSARTASTAGGMRGAHAQGALFQSHEPVLLFEVHAPAMLLQQPDDLPKVPSGCILSSRDSLEPCQPCSARSDPAGCQVQKPGDRPWLYSAGQLSGCLWSCQGDQSSAQPIFCKPAQRVRTSRGVREKRSTGFGGTLPSTSSQRTTEWQPSAAARCLPCTGQDRPRARTWSASTSSRDSHSGVLRS